ncbi:MAG: copper resistance protein B [Lysobacter sp.]|nr:copper resistance protein B [Lysobacter sp.]
MSALNLLTKSVLSVALLAFAATAAAQDHSQHQMPMPTAPAKTTPKKIVKKPVAKPAAKPAGKKPAANTSSSKPDGTTPSTMDHSAMGHDMGAMKPAAKKKPVSKPSTTKIPAAMDHSAMGHDMGAMQPATKKKPAAKPSLETPTSKTPAAAMDHSAMGHDMNAIPNKPDQAVDHSTMDHDMDAMPQAPTQAMDHSAMRHDMPMPTTEPLTPIPALTDADRAAAFPDIAPHQMQGGDIHSFVLLDRLEAWNDDNGTGMEWEGLGWIGTDLNRVWLRSEGERVDGATEAADLEVLYGRSIARWWDLVAGVRHDFKPGDSQSFAAIGIQGLAPQKFEVEATAYVGESGQTALRLEAERDLLLTNRLILQPLVEGNFHGKDDPRRGIGSGLSTIEAGLRLRYEFTRKFAPYVGIVREHAFGGTADLRRADGEDVNDTRFVAGLRIWF